MQFADLLFELITNENTESKEILFLKLQQQARMCIGVFSFRVER